jgi:hypothetical protein
MGKPVKEVTYRVLGGQQVVLHETSYGPIPEQTDHFRFPLAGPFIHRAKDGVPAWFNWGFAIEFLDGNVPKHVVIEDVTGQGPQLLVDDPKPILHANELPTWHGDAAQCVVFIGNPCATWLFSRREQRFILRATITLADGSTDVLYQAVLFDPKALRSLLDAMDIDR